MHKLILLFHKPDDVDQFEQRWSHEFVPTAEAMPALRRVSISRIHGGLSPDSDIYLVHELYFDDRRSLEEAMASAEGQHAGKLLVSIVGDKVDVLFAEHLEDGPHPPKSSG
ncbi:MAG: EthD family reductase [Anaerolineales bacterium]